MSKPILQEQTVMMRPGRAIRLRTRLAFSIAAGALLGVAVAAFSPGSFWAGWLAATLLAAPAVFVLFAAWQWAGGGRALAWMVALAFLLRLVAGAGLSLALPRWGNPEPEQQAGYLFKDASFRDQQAWDLAVSDVPVWATFREEFVSDQYGGLLALSALVYRLLSPDAHRSFLILILGAFFAALGVPFLVQAVRLRWPARVAVLAGWIYVLYPDAVFFASSQMREPFLVGLACIAFWAVLAWEHKRPVSWFALGGSLAGMALISTRVAMAVAGFLALLFLLEQVAGRKERKWQILGVTGLVIGMFFLFWFSWSWFRSSAAWDVKVTASDSGSLTVRVQEVSRLLGLAREDVRIPIVVIYGLTRPLLPAAIADPSIPLWRAIAIIRSAGWYALAPFLLYSLLAVWRQTDTRHRRLVLWLVFTVVLWLLIASARGGGDATDNPRYRSLFIPWMALLAAWAIDWALAHQDAWLWRLVAVEAIFLGFFTHWYLSRYLRLWARLEFWEMAAWIAGLSGLVLVGGWLYDRRRMRKQSAPVDRAVQDARTVSSPDRLK